MTDDPAMLVLDGDRYVVLSAEQVDELQRQVLELGSGEDARSALRRLLEVEAFAAGPVSMSSLVPALERADVEALLADLEPPAVSLSSAPAPPDAPWPRERSPGTRARRAWKRRRRGGRGGRR